MSRSLFGELLVDEAGGVAAAVEARPEGPFAQVTLENSLDKVLDYAIPPGLRNGIKVGQRVRVPLGRGNKPSFGWVVGVAETTTYPKIKSLTDIEDERVLVTPGLMELARWMSRYYCSPLGTVLESVIPAAVKKKIGIGYAQVVRLAKPPAEVQELLEKARSKKQRGVLGRLLQLPEGEGIEIHKLAEEAGTTPATVRKVARAGVASIASEIEWGSVPSEWAKRRTGEPATDFPLNEDQQRVMDELGPRVKGGGFSVNLLFGVTGSGKTEVYLRCLKEVIDSGKSAIVMVPEIALTPQTVRRFTQRFDNVAILHSGLTQTERHRYWQTILRGEAQVVVGARSSVFAPVPNLGLIVVDEEHESSYKQDTQPRYHGRDVAIKRGQIEGCPVVLGSATPSLEMWQRVGGAKIADCRLPIADSQLIRGDRSRDAETVAAVVGGETKSKSESAIGNRQSKIPASDAGQLYHLLTLPRRVRGLAMPHVELVDMKMEGKFRKGVHLLSQRLEHLLRVTVESGRQAILLLNRRGYSNFVYCASCQEPIHCKYCDTTMTYHRSAPVEQAAGYVGASIERGVHTGQLHCHYCLAINPLPATCETCKKKLTLFGLGTQRVEEELARKFPNLNYARVDSDTMRSGKDYEALLERFGRGEVQVMLGTQMIAKGLDYPNVTLVGVISGDTALALPDFRAGERTFQLITQVAGRAGRGDNPGRVVLQTFIPEDLTIQSAIKQDFVGFARRELATRREVGLPPFGRMVRIIIREQEQEKLHKYSDEIAAELTAAVAKENERLGAAAVVMKGPMPCAISRIAGYFRNQIVLQSARPDGLQRVLAEVRGSGNLTRAERVAVDVDPVSLL